MMGGISMKSIKRVFLLLLTVLFFCVCSFSVVVYAETESNSVMTTQTKAYQIKINLTFLEYGQEITPELFGVQGLKIAEIIKIKGYNDDTGINELTGYFVIVEIPVNENIDEIISSILSFSFVEEVDEYCVPGDFELNIDIDTVNPENRINSVFGDVDSDYKITAADARYVLRVAAKLEKVNEINLGIADIDGDKRITSADARKILRVCANLEELNVNFNMIVNTDYLIGPVGSDWYIGKWQIDSADDNLNITKDYTLDVSSPGNMGYDYYLVSADESGEYVLVLKNDTQNKVIKVTIIAEN